MTLRGKLLVAQLPLAIALVAVGGISLRATRSLGSSSASILKDNYRSVLAAQRMNQVLDRLDDAATALVLGERTSAEARARELRRRFDEELRVQEGNITESGERETTHRLQLAWDAYQRSFDQLTAITDPSAARAFLIQALQPSAEKIRAVSNEVLDINQDAMVRKSELAQRAASRVVTLLLGATLFALIAGGIASSTLTSRLLRPMSVLAQAARRIGEGDLDARARVSGNDEVGQLAREFNEMASHLQRYRETTLGELLQAQGAAQAAIDSLPDAVIAFDGSGSLLAVNQVAERELQVSLENGAAALASAALEVRSVLERLREHVLGGQGPYQPKGYEEAIRVAGQEGERWLLPRATPVHAEGGVRGVTIVLQDVTRLRRFDELKNDLVATVAHEFRTPLTSLRMAIHLCLEGAAGPMTEKQVELLHASREDCERLQAIVDDLLDLSRMQSGRVELEKQRVPVHALLERTRDAAASQASGKALSIAIEALDDEVVLDPERIELVFSNLLANAIRYSPPGETLVLRARPLEGAVRFEVVDHGPGVPAAYRERIFEKYFRVPGAPSGSAGLGLYISREIVLAHGGKIGAEPGDQKGSIFWFTIPK